MEKDDTSVVDGKTVDSTVISDSFELWHRMALFGVWVWIDCVISTNSIQKKMPHLTAVFCLDQIQLSGNVFISRFYHVFEPFTLPPSDSVIGLPG